MTTMGKPPGTTTWLSRGWAVARPTNAEGDDWSWWARCDGEIREGFEATEDQATARAQDTYWKLQIECRLKSRNDPSRR